MKTEKKIEVRGVKFQFGKVEVVLSIDETRKLYNDLKGLCVYPGSDMYVYPYWNFSTYDNTSSQVTYTSGTDCNEKVFDNITTT